MDLEDLFTFGGKFSKKDRVFTLSFKIAKASAIWSCFDEKSVLKMKKWADKDLLKAFDSIFEHAYFISLIDTPGDEDLNEDFLKEYYEFEPGNKPSNVLGTWKYVRRARLVSLDWNVPDWFQPEKGRFYVSDFELISNTCRDWFVNAP